MCLQTKTQKWETRANATSAPEKKVASAPLPKATLALEKKVASTTEKKRDAPVMKLR